MRVALRVSAGFVVVVAGCSTARKVVLGTAVCNDGTDLLADITVRSGRTIAATA